MSGADDNDDSVELGPDETDADLLDDERTETIRCPSCGGQVYEHADRCNICGQYITRRDSFWAGRGLWSIALGLAGVAALLIALLKLR